LTICVDEYSIAILFGILKRLLTYLMRKAERKQSAKYIHPIKHGGNGTNGKRINSRGDAVEMAWGSADTLTSPQPNKLRSPVSNGNGNDNVAFPPTSASGGSNDKKQQNLNKGLLSSSLPSSDAMSSLPSPIPIAIGRPKPLLPSSALTAVAQSSKHIDNKGDMLHDNDNDNEEGHDNMSRSSRESHTPSVEPGAPRDQLDNDIERKEGEPLHHHHHHHHHDDNDNTTNTTTGVDHKAISSIAVSVPIAIPIVGSSVSNPWSPPHHRHDNPSATATAAAAAMATSSSYDDNDNRGFVIRSNSGAAAQVPLTAV
jgi:hypothetical protein